MKENEYLKPTNDYVFKKIFGTRGNESITRNFIEKVTGVRYEDIYLEDTTILGSDLIDGKTGVLDVRVTANKNNDIDIEMQVAKNEYIADRLLWYWAKLYSSSLDKGEGYDNTKKTICILVADFEINTLKSIEKYHTKWNIREDKYREIILTDKLELHIIDLTKLDKKADQEEGLLSWCKFIKDPEKLEGTIMKENEDIKKAKEELEKINQNEYDRMIAELREKAVRDNATMINSGYKKGKEEGLKEGELNKQLEIAKNMIKEGIGINIISKVTGLSVEKLKEL